MAFQSFFSGKLKHYNKKDRGIVTAKESANPTRVIKRDISMEEHDSVFEDCENDETTALKAMADAFEDLSGLIKENGPHLDLTLKPFCHACSFVSVLFGFLGFAFKFAEMEYTSKVRNLEGASETYGTLNNILDFDVRNDSVKIQGSLSRNLRRVRQGLDLMRVLFQNFLSAEYVSLFKSILSLSILVGPQTILLLSLRFLVLLLRLLNEAIHWQVDDGNLFFGF
ncbi:hypothetical protein Leryth_025950 [Lithospermum erythrorhizon]|nr:hypothetical protein Leryth_025950 [Lithospermum erythrorhizon]